MSAPPLVAQGLGKRFRRHDWALRDLTLAIPKGGIVGLAGPNAAGKSTLLSLAAGLLAPSEGSIAVFGRDPLQAPEVLAEVGYVAQGAPLYRSFRVADTLEYARRTNPRWDAEIAVELLTRIDSQAKVGALSAGERARLALASALGKRPRLVLLDEPFASLDPLAGRELLQLLMDGVAELGATVIVASHVVADIQRVCDHIVLLSERLRPPRRRGRRATRFASAAHRPAPAARLDPGRTRDRARAVQRPPADTARHHRRADRRSLLDRRSGQPRGATPRVHGARAPAHATDGGKDPAAMAWVTWRQHRSHAFGALGLLVALAARSGPHAPADLVRVRPRLALGLPAGPPRTGCDIIVPHFESEFSGLVTATRVLAVLPAARRPLRRRSVDRPRARVRDVPLRVDPGRQPPTWLLSKTALLAAGTRRRRRSSQASLVMWWRSPFDQLEGRIGPSGFDIEGIVVPAYALFALALGVLAGLVFRRTVAAMTATLVAFGATRALVVRPSSGRTSWHRCTA